MVISCNYSNGLLNGDYIQNGFIRSKQNTYLKQKLTYSNGKPIGVWGFYGEDESLNFEIKFIGSSKIILSDKRGSKTIEEIYLKDKEMTEKFNCLQFSNYFLPKDFSCNRITTTFYNGKVKRIEYFGTEKYKIDKKFIEYYENGNIKFEGVYGQNVTFFDIQGNIVNKANFDAKTIYYEQDDYDTQRTQIESPFK